MEDGLSAWLGTCRPGICIAAALPPEGAEPGERKPLTAEPAAETRAWDDDSRPADKACNALKAEDKGETASGEIPGGLEEVWPAPFGGSVLPGAAKAIVAYGEARSNNNIRRGDSLCLKGRVLDKS